MREGVSANRTALREANAHATVAGQAGPLLTVDGGGFDTGGFGMVAAREATELACAVAAEHGVCVLMLRNCHHIGRVGTYGELAAARIGLGRIVALHHRASTL